MMMIVWKRSKKQEEIMVMKKIIFRDRSETSAGRLGTKSVELI